MQRPLAGCVTALLLLCGDAARAQGTAASRDPSRKFEITDNSFLVEESFNQEAGVFQNIFTWTRDRSGAWESTFTQEWPLGGMAHQFSYTIPFSGGDGVSGLNDILFNYRYQLLNESASRPAVSPRLSLIVPSGRTADGLGNGVVGLQTNVPVSKQFGDVYLHVNAGVTWLPSVSLDEGPSAPTRTLTSPFLAAGGIFRVAPMLHLMVEALAEFDAEATPQPSRTRTVTLSPGFRTGWNVGERQIVIGAAAPVSRAEGHTSVALLTYFSYELPFR